MGTTVGFERREFWEREKEGQRDTPCKFNDIMSRYRFEDILINCSFVLTETLTYEYKFWEVRHMLDMWNTNMDEKLLSSWLTFIDARMSKWVKRFSFPSFIVVPRNPWP